MAEPKHRPVLVRQVRLWWYAVAIVPIGLLVYAGFSGMTSPVIGIVGLFAAFFWLFSFIFAVASKLRRPPPDLRP